MSYSIRLYTPTDYPMILSWWLAQKEPGPTQDMLPQTTVIVEDAGIPILCHSLILTNVKAFAYVAFLIGNPSVKGKQKAVEFLMEYWKVVARERGYNRLLTFPHKEKVKALYESYGFKKTIGDITGYALEVGE